MNIPNNLVTAPQQQLPPLTKQSSTYKMFIPKKVEEKIRYLIRKFPHTEWSGVLFYTHTGNFEDNNLEIHCEDLYPMDLGTGGWTEFKMTPDVTSYIANNIDLFDCETGLIHSHHSLGAFISGQDSKTLQIEGNDTNCFVSLIVDTKGTYVAAITRKVKVKKQIITKDLGSTYQFFGEGEWTSDPANGSTIERTIEDTTIEYFMLDIQVEHVSNPLDYLDIRFEEIEAKKKETLKVPAFQIEHQTDFSHKPIDEASYASTEDDKEFFDWLHSERKKSAEAKEAILFDKETMDDMTDISKWQPDPTIIHYLVCQLLTCSLIVNKDIDLKQWVHKHMVKKYTEIFADEGNYDFNMWSDSYVEFIVNHYSDSNAPVDVYDDMDFLLSKVSEAILTELGEYSSNPFIEGYSEVLSRYLV